MTSRSFNVLLVITGILSVLAVLNTYVFTDPVPGKQRGPQPANPPTPTYVMAPWGKSPYLFPVQLGEGVGAGFDDTFVRVYAVVADKFGQDLLMVEGYQLDHEGKRVSQTGIVGQVLSCNSGALWIKWTEGAFYENFDGANSRAQAACEEHTL